MVGRRCRLIRIMYGLGPVSLPPLSRGGRWPRISGLRLPLVFFQAEDGIRDWSMTGLQTCDLPISYAVFCLKSEKRTMVVQSINNTYPRHLIDYSRCDANITIIICSSSTRYALQ